ncbi:Protein CHROMATIN REMODELING 4 [Striga hermonthica]|uniref:Protein CHROMATIN REMODELING 4 n=1 Tax=Striga hermonthica TaxID=68872 RepID=A0A9N7RKB6_STRHE|nr:Protein CHROMATIN REMODELING 4 [Striga hermonthica]
MGSKIVVTYKRKRLFSRSNYSQTNLQPDRPPEIAEVKTSVSLDNYKVSTAEHTLPNNKEFWACHGHSKDKDGENVLQCKNSNSTCCSQCSKANESQRLCPACMKQQDSLLSNPTPEPNLDTEQIPTHLDVPLEVCSRDRHLLDSAVQPKAKEEPADTQSESLFPKLDLEFDDNCKSGFPSEENCNPVSGIESGVVRLEASDGINCSRQTKATSLSGTLSSEGAKLNKVELCSNSVTKRKLASSLITFCRRLKKNRDNAAIDTVSVCRDKCVSVKSLAASCSVELMNEKKPAGETDNFCSASGPTAEIAMQVDNPMHSPYEKATNGPTTVVQNFLDLSNLDVTSRGMPSNIPGIKGSSSSLDLSISPPVSRDIDCNIPLDCDSHENYLHGPLEDLHDCLGSNRNTSTSQVTSVIDKGKFVVESLPVKNIQHEFRLFPENPTNITPNVLPPSFHSPSLHDWAHFQPPHETLLPSISNHPTSSLSSHLMMLDTLLARARGKFDFPTIWSEDELDCLWVGVRRHGVNNWPGILMDRKLHFSSWKTARDLADRWRYEQHRLFHGGPVSQVRFSGRPATGFSDGVQNPLLQECGARKRHYVHYMNLLKRRQFQKTPVYSNGNLPHWLREAVELPPRTYGPTQNVTSSWVCNPNAEQLYENTRNDPVLRQANQQTSNKPGDLIAVSSDASSEETVSDDHSIRV